MNRRQLLAATTTGIAASVTGCAGAPSDSPEPDPEPAASELRISVTNDDSTTHSVSFVLATTREESTTITGFELAGIEPGETRTREPESLDPGEYSLEVDLTTKGMGTETEWAGHDCPVKDLDIGLRENGFRIRNECVDD